MNEPPPPDSSPYWRESGRIDAPENDVPTDDPPRAPADQAPPDGAAPALTVVAVVSAVIGMAAMVVAVMLTDPQQSIGTASAAVPVIAVVATLTAAVIGVVLLERRRGRRALLAVVVGLSAVGVAVSAATLLPLPDLGVHAYGYACPFYATNVQDSVGRTPDEPLPYGSSIAVSAATQQQAWTTFTVAAPIDVTAPARTAGERLPRSGSYYAVPVIRGTADDAVMTCNDPLKEQTYWVSESGTEIADTPLSLPAYPGGAQGGQAGEDGSVTYYVVFDITPDTARSGTFSMSQLASDDTYPDEVFWGVNPGSRVVEASPVVPGEASPPPSGSPAPTDASSTDVYVADPHARGLEPDAPLSFGDSLTMQSAATGKDALTFVVNGPITILDPATPDTPEPDGSYIAVPIQSTEIDADAISDSENTYYPPDYWLTPDGQTIEETSVTLPGYPSLQDAEHNPDGTWSFFAVFDVPNDSIDGGQFQLELTAPDGTVQDAYWGPNE